MLEYGPKRMQGQRVQVPRLDDLKPSLEYLEARVWLFEAA